jgi:arylsulfatase
MLTALRLVTGMLVLVTFAGCTRQDSTTSRTQAGEARGKSTAADRTILPLPEPPVASITEVDARKATAPPRFEVKAPARAPNVVIVLIDDIGFGQAGAFGGPVNMPTLEEIANHGLRYNRFHTTALCSPTRTALLTGRNHHVNNAGAIMELATSFPGNTGVRPNSVAPMAEILRLNGYSTAAFGKYHETAPWEVSVSGPFDRWPTRSGFDKFYEGVTRVEHAPDPHYHFTTDMTDQAIAWTRFQQSMTPDKPFFIYFATGATHAPHHAPPEYIEKYRGKFDRGWDVLREETLARQIQLGVVPAGTKLTPRPAEIPAWDSLSPDQKRLCARQMEAFAGFAEHTDHEVGRLVQALRDMGELDNTLFMYVVGDNGASAEGGPDGSYNEILALNGIVSDVSSQLSHIDEWGGPMTFPHYSIGWALAGNTPFQWTKQVASHFGGTRNPLVISWPARLPDAHGEVRSQFHHVIDLAPTVLEAAGLPEPKMVNGTQQHLRRPPGQGPAHHPVLRDVREPRHLPRRVGGGDSPLDPMAHGPAAAVLGRPLGALSHRRRFQRSQRSRRRQSGEAEGAASALHPGGDQEPRVPARRSADGALRCRDCRPPRPHGAPHFPHLVRRDDRHR